MNNIKTQQNLQLKFYSLKLKKFYRIFIIIVVIVIIIYRAIYNYAGLPDTNRVSRVYTDRVILWLR